MNDDSSDAALIYAGDDSDPSPRDDLLLAAWLDRDLPPREFLLGNVLCTTSRFLIYGDTGIGKTLLALDMAGAIASGRPFLGWEGRQPACVMYIDGEMPAETFKERMQLVAEQFGSDIPLYGYNRDDLGYQAPPPFNSEEGAAWLMREIELVQPKAIFFDSIMCLTIGSMSEEESWAPLKSLIRKLSSMRICQIWLHHTGHDPTKGFGTKTREWELDSVAALKKSDADSVRLEFSKARLRTPETARQFAPRILKRTVDGWTATEADDTLRKGANEIENLKTAILQSYDRLADGIDMTPGLDGKPVRKVAVDKLRDALKSRGFLDADGNALTSTSRGHFRKAKATLIADHRLIEADGAIWKL